MTSQSIPSDSLEDGGNQVSGAITLAILVSVGLGGLLALLWPGPTGLATFAVGLSGTAVGLIGVAVFHHHRFGRSLTGLLLGGQIIALVAIAFLFLVSLVR